MTLYVTESEMIERYVDGLRQAASRAKEFISSEPQSRPKLFTSFIAGIKTSAGSAHQLAHAQMNPRWLDIRDVLEKIIDIGQTLPTLSGETNMTWMSLSQTLDGMVDTGKKLAGAKAMTRPDVIANLDYRKRIADTKLSKEVDV